MMGRLSTIAALTFRRVVCRWRVARPSVVAVLPSALRVSRGLSRPLRVDAAFGADVCCLTEGLRHTISVRNREGSGG